MTPETSIEIVLNGQVFRLRCPEGEEPHLRKAAERVEAKLHEITRGGGIVDSLRASLLAAFHLAYDLLDHEENSFRRSPEYEKIQERLKTLADEIETNLSNE